MNDKEKKAGATPAATASTERKEVAVVRILAGGTRQVRSTFHFDDVLTSFSSQEDVFRATLQPLVGQVLAGYETTAFAYGQTGTGKTYTMEGQLDSVEGRGLVPRTAAAVLEALATSEFTDSSVTVSYLEIYNEELSDLLASSDRHPKLDLKDIGQGRGVCCQGLSEVEVQSMDDILEVVRRAQEKRRVAETRVNARSSRSHSIFTMKVRCQRAVAGGELENQGKLHLVDLAGSECAKKGGLVYSEDVSAAARMLAGQEEERERRSINQSLLTLGRVITALREGSGRVPYRDSKLTRLLQDALGGRCKTVIIATISPALASVEETISALSYAEQAAGIRNRPVASSLLRSTTVSAQARTVAAANAHGDVSSNSGLGASEWAELEMKVTYLSQELEEAQVALGRKYQEAQEEAERAHRAEMRLDQTLHELRKVTVNCEEQSFAKQRFAQLAAGRHEAATSLQSSLAVMDQHRVALEKHLESVKEEQRSKQTCAVNFCQQLSNSMAKRLHEKMPPAPHDLHDKLTALEEQRRANGAVIPNGSEVEEKIFEMNATHTETIKKLQEDHQQQGETLMSLASNLQEHREEHGKQLRSTSTEAQHDFLENLSKTNATLLSIEDAFSSAVEGVQSGATVQQCLVTTAQQRLNQRCAALRTNVAENRAALQEAQHRSRAALQAAEKAMMEVANLSEESLKEALEAVDELEEMHMKVLSEMTDETTKSVGTVEAASSAGRHEVDVERQRAAESSEQQQKRWESMTDLLTQHAQAEDVLLQTAKVASKEIQEASQQRTTSCLEKTDDMEGHAVCAVQALRRGAAEALEQQTMEVQNFVESNKARMIDEEVPTRSKALPEVYLPPLPSEEQLLSEFQMSRQPMSSGLISNVTTALKNSKQQLSPVQVSNIQDAMQLLDLPLEDKPHWGAAATRGLFLVFEGLDRSGKSTQSKKLEEHLSKVSPGPVKWMCFPNRKTPIGIAIDLYLRRQLELPDEAVHRLFSANRWEMAKSIVEDLRAGTTIICDRYAFSGVAYSAAKGLDFTWCQSPDRGLPCPDGVFFLHIDEKVGAARSNFGDERYENPEMQAKVRAQFKDPRLRAHVKWQDVNGARDVEVIHAEIRSAVESLRQEDQENRQRPIGRLWVK